MWVILGSLTCGFVELGAMARGGWFERGSNRPSAVPRPPSMPWACVCNGCELAAGCGPAAPVVCDERVGKPVEQVLEHAGNLVVVLGGKDPQDVCRLDLRTHARNGIGRGKLDVLVHEGNVRIVEVAHPGTVCDDAPCLVGELTVEGLLARRAERDTFTSPS